MGTRLSNDELRKSLQAYGENVGPVTHTTRALYEKRLLHLKRKHGSLTNYGTSFSIKTLCPSDADYNSPSFFTSSEDKSKEALDALSEDFKNLFINKYCCDTTLYVGEKEYKAHKTVLIARSSVFAAMFLHDTSEKQTGIINITDCDPDSFEIFLEFLYSGKLDNLSFRNALHLYETSDKYDVQGLKSFCTKCLIENLSMENVCDLVIFADKYEELNVMSAAQDFFNENFSEILDTSTWDSLVKDNYRLAKKLLKGYAKS